MSEYFRSAVRFDGARGVGSTPAGTVLELQLPPERKFRTVWCYFDNYQIDEAPNGAIGDEAWINFYRRGELVADMPAVVRIVDATIRFGVANYYAQAIGGNSAAPGSAGVLWFNDGSGNDGLGITPFRLVGEFDLVRLISNKAGSTRAVLAVLSVNETP